MKLRSITLILTLLLALVAFTACGGDPAPSDPPPAEGNTVYESGTTVRIIRSEGCIVNDVTNIVNKLTTLTGKIPNTFFDASEPASSEIVLGDTSREVSALARQYVKSLEITDSGVAAWCIYAKDGSIAVWWSEDIEPLAETAVTYLLDSLLTKETLTLTDGLVHYEEFDLSAFGKEREEAIRRAQLDEIEAILGKEARDAIEDYLSLFREELYIWLANLYDPETGGFYYSNSARDTLGYLPDIESTVQALNLLSSFGMLEQYDNDLGKALPDWMKEKVISFATSLQSPEDGYFYHPQWGKSITTSRRARDLDWATDIVAKLGGQILYDAPNGVKGSLGAPGAASAAALTGRLGASATAAVSGVIAVSDSTLPTHLQSLDNFKKYLDSFDWDGSSYSAGNTIGAQSSQIIARGQEYVDAVGEILNAKQEEIQEKLRDAAEAEARKANASITDAEVAEVRRAAENGLWEEKVTFNSVNGLMKISGTYTDLGLKINYPEAATASALEMVYLEGADASGKKPINAVDVFNPWVCIRNIQLNVNTYDRDAATAMQEALREDAVELIKVTKRKVVVFAKDDGSWGYNVSQVPGTSQGAPVAVGGTNEGDVNGAGLSINGPFGYMCGCLGISKPNLFFNSDFEKFIEIVENLTPVVKSDPPQTNLPFDFEEDTVGSREPLRVSAGSMGGGYVEITEDDRAGGGNVLKFVSVSGNGSTASFPTAGIQIGNCNVLEFDINIAENNWNTVIYQIRLGSSYMFTVRTTASGFQLGDSSSTDSKVSVANWFEGTYDYGKWYTIRIEHYNSDVASEIANVIYVNGEAVAVTNNYFGKVRDGVISDSEPNDTYSSASFYALYAADMTVLLDNITAGKISKEYVTPDGFDTEERVYEGVLDFEGSKAVPAEIVHSSNGQPASGLSVVADPEPGEGEKAGNVLHFTTGGAPEGGGGNILGVKPAYEVDKDANCYVFSGDFLFKDFSGNSIPFQLYFQSGNDVIYAINIPMAKTDDGITVAFREKNEANDKHEVFVQPFLADGWVNIRIEYYKDQGIAQFYVDGVCVAENATVWNSTNTALTFDYLKILALRATNSDTYVDNLTAQLIKKTYQPLSN